MRADVFEAIGKPIDIHDDEDTLATRADKIRVKGSFCSVRHSYPGVVDGALPAFGHVAPADVRLQI